MLIIDTSDEIYFKYLDYNFLPTKNKILITDLPKEILILIFSFINDTNTYKNIRITCNMFYKILKENKIFKDNIEIYKIKYYENKISYFNNKNILEIDIIFKKYGEIKTINYLTNFNSDYSFNELNINPPNNAIIIQQNNYFEKKTKYDFTNNNIKSFYKPKYIPRLTNQYCIIS